MERDRRYYDDYDRDRSRDRGRDRDWDREREYERRHAAPPPRKKKKKKRSALSSSMIYILMVCGVSAILATLGWTMANDMLALNKDEVEAVITIQDEKNFGKVADQLKDNDIINYKFLFRLFATFSGKANDIVPGQYKLDTSMDYSAILNNLSSSSASRMTTTVTIPEGYSMAQIFQLLEKKGVSTVEKLEDMAANHDYDFSFLQDIPMGEATRLEGYLFPDTYTFYLGEDPKYVINKMLVNFDAKVTDAIRQQIWDQGKSIGEILNVASMIEKETDGTDRATIASVIYNRLNNPSGGTQGYLQIDATIQYVLPEGEIVSKEDYDTVDSPYNTYLNKGLPPGPIANPGMESIMAAINPESTNYYYYALGDDKVHHFFTSLSEHEAFLNS
ncbi:endolytic transglycosylase MltG [Evtepia sp.]|uniref:endolytic transglycosylase MltG n=1 Tax=Evtepia sp. TaxID=2773933 RepID=UPI003F13F376